MSDKTSDNKTSDSLEEEKYELTPNGLFIVALMKTHLIENIDDWKAELAWELFIAEMEKRGYVRKEN